MITPLFMLLYISFSMYTTKLLFIHWSPIRFRNLFFTMFIVENAIHHPLTIRNMEGVFVENAMLLSKESNPSSLISWRRYLHTFTNDIAFTISWSFLCSAFDNSFVNPNTFLIKYRLNTNLCYF